MSTLPDLSHLKKNSIGQSEIVQSDKIKLAEFHLGQ